MVDRQKVGSFIGLCRGRRERFVARMIEMHEPTGMSRVKINLRPISVFFVDLNGRVHRESFCVISRKSFFRSKRDLIYELAGEICQTYYIHLCTFLVHQSTNVVPRDRVKKRGILQRVPSQQTDIFTHSRNRDSYATLTSANAQLLSRCRHTRVLPINAKYDAFVTKECSLSK